MPSSHPSADVSFQPTSEPTGSVRIAAEQRLEGMTYGDLVPYLEGSVFQAELGLLRVSQLARAHDELSPAHAADAVKRAVDFLDHESGVRSQNSGVRVQAVLALEAIAGNKRLLPLLPREIRERAFSVLALLPIARSEEAQFNQSLVTHITGPYRESDKDVRALSERAAALFAPSHRPELDSLTGE